jgi:hypothetical protein
MGVRGPPIRGATWKRRGNAGPRRRVAAGRDGSRRNVPVAGHFTQPAMGGSSPRVDGKEGVAGSSPAEGFGNRAMARFSRFRSGLGDAFRVQRRGQSLPSASAAPGVDGSRGVASSRPKVPTRYRPGASLRCRTLPWPASLGPRSASNATPTTRRTAARVIVRGTQRCRAPVTRPAERGMVIAAATLATMARSRIHRECGSDPRRAVFVFVDSRGGRDCREQRRAASRCALMLVRGRDA